MNFLPKIFKRSNTNNIKQLSINNKVIEDETNITQAIEIIPLSDKYLGRDDEQLFWQLEGKELNDEELTDEEKIFIEDKGREQLAKILHREFFYARSLAIKELVNNNYQILLDESGNQFKEVINFTLQYFRQCFINKSDEADRL